MLLIICRYLRIKYSFNPLSANPTKGPNTLKQFVGNLPINCLSVLDHFVGLALKGLKKDLTITLGAADLPISQKPQRSKKKRGTALKILLMQID